MHLIPPARVLLSVRELPSVVVAITGKCAAVTERTPSFTSRPPHMLSPSKRSKRKQEVLERLSVVYGRWPFPDPPNTGC